ncbi:MAG: ParB/RepB/Spo0J family partition protein [Planctomycetes bacterium]|nr:ParB/RepB/Spo0J family partition protein [Planctomycetota bacterium]
MANIIKARTPRLGKGLSSLMGQPVIVPAPAHTNHPNPAPPASHPPGTPTGLAGGTHVISFSPSAAPPAAPPADAVLLVPIASILTNPHQPRQRFDETALHQLAESIKSEGLIQPVILRRSPSSPTLFELVAGERRWRAAQMAGLEAIPALVRDLDDRKVAEWALVENLQREDLNPIERAEAFQHLLTHFHLSHEEIAERVGVERSSVSNSLRLLALQEDVRAWIQEGRVSGGQAKALAGLSDPAQQKTLAERAIRHDWSVRQVEQAVRHATGQTAEAAGAGESAPRAMPTRPAHLSDLEEQIGRQLQTKVHLRAGRRKGAGTLTIEFYSLDQFDALMAQMGVKTEE